MDLGPGAAWYAVAAAALAAAATVVVVAFTGGDLGQRVAPGQPVRLNVPDGGRIIWTTGGFDVDCDSSGAEARNAAWSMWTLRDVDIRLSDGGLSWRGAMILEATPPGEYVLTCTARDGASLAVGEPPPLHDAYTRFLAFAGAVVLALIGLVTGVLVTVRRRRAGRKPYWRQEE
ncbi:hypothetical protein AB0M02_26890 [Actinoplanes sp. NPDC051861]|uniref:hypothetical protein n=1 Tax=Actinoplanes sp. NPDC051861 TaxID=3155170 RepID=UPI003441641F